MKLLARVGLAGIVGVVALALAGAALASYAPRLVVGHSARAATTGSVSIDVALAAADDPTQSLTIYTPIGYTANPSAAPGTQIGTVEVQAQAADLGGQTLTAAGTVTIADPTGTITFAGAATPISTLAQSCTQSPTHAAVWLLTLAANGQELQWPAYVDATSGTEAAVGGFKIQVCLPPPDVPQGTAGRAEFGAKVFHAKLTLTNVFTTPSTPNIYIWRALLTPYTPSAGTADAAATLEVRSVALMPITLTLTAKYDAKTKSARLSGSLGVAGQPAIGIAVPLFAGPTSNLRKLKRSGATSKTDKSGRFTVSRRIVKTTYFIVVIGTGGDATQPACSQTLAPLGAPCTSATFAEVATTSALVKVVVPKAKPRKKRKGK